MQASCCNRCGAPVVGQFCARCGANLGEAGAIAVVGAAPPAAKNQPRALVGLVSLAILGVTIWYLAQPSSGTGPASPKGSTVTVTYKLTGSATSADLTYMDGSGNVQQQTGKAVPLRRTSGADGLSIVVHHGAYVSLMAQNNDAAGDLTCTIEADGVVINTGHSSGGYAIASCSAMVP